MQKLISDLFDRWADKPILVIGGGPSVNDDLPRLVATPPACVIGANDHGAHQKVFPVDLCVNLDKIHCFRKLPMEHILRPLGAPIANKLSWADYRLADWPALGNTGMASIAVAAALGGNPVIVTGLDFWHGGRRYFHKVDEETRRSRKPMVLTHFHRKKLKDLVAFVKGANIRPMSGPLCDIWPKYSVDEVLPARKDVAYRRKMRSIKPTYLRALRPFSLSNMDAVRTGQILVTSPGEAESLVAAGKAGYLHDKAELS